MILRKTLLIGLLLSAAGAGMANEPKSSSAEAVALLKKAQEYLKTNGLEKSIIEFNNPNSPFNSKSDINKHGDLYLYSVDPKGFQVVHGINPRIRGTNKFDMRDVDGVYLIREFVRVCFATPEGRGWVNYRWPNPVSKQMEDKAGYVERIGNTDLCLGTGIYK
ncbi:cache domain-containing protein [Roseateles oligotrophus]|uniref:Cache domain-containing protein n=1 Tax=Roseateles oligotrophus TaxID=1769250 RepID=A0ABT2YM56_9BURK|nr:cache domain-containing protein [Roseateles oligotrophus]MCV2371143.1 cache domain-containing protein [Roseateles oligotrophus]